MPPKVENVHHVYPQAAEGYELLWEIGIGSSATVWEAKVKDTDEHVAVKIVNLEKTGTSLEEIRKEIRIISTCHHPNIISYHTSFVNGQDLWLVMQLVEGGSLFDIMRATGSGLKDEELIATILRQALQGMAYLHENGHIHRDIKAANLLVDKDGAVRLADFGVSALLSEGFMDRRQVRQTFVGTPCWMAPEVLEQTSGYNNKADVWSFGITALELANGHAPFHGYPPMKVLLMTLQKEPPSLDSTSSDKKNKYSNKFKEMVDVCLKKEPRDRATTAQLKDKAFFKLSKKPDYIVKQLLSKVPSLRERTAQLKAQLEKEELNAKAQLIVERDNKLNQSPQDGQQPPQELTLQIPMPIPAATTTTDPTTPSSELADTNIDTTTPAGGGGPLQISTTEVGGASTGMALGIDTSSTTPTSGGGGGAGAGWPTLTSPKHATNTTRQWAWEYPTKEQVEAFNQALLSGTSNNTHTTTTTTTAGGSGSGSGGGPTDESSSSSSSSSPQQQEGEKNQQQGGTSETAATTTTTSSSSSGGGGEGSGSSGGVINGSSSSLSFGSGRWHFSASHNYIKGEFVGTGGHKEVFRGTDLRTNTPIAWHEVKMNNPGSSWKDDASVADALYSAIEKLTALRQDNLVPLYDAWETDTELVFITPFYDTNLGAYIATNGPLPLALVQSFTKQLLLTLKYLHSQGVVHRNLDTSELLLSPDRSKVLLCETILWPIKADKRYGIQLKQREQYLAFEQYDEDDTNIPITPKIDVYSLGMVVLEMLSGKQPYCECSNPMQICARVARGAQPESLKKLEYPVAKEFIVACINTEVSERPAVEDLFDHPFVRET